MGFHHGLSGLTAAARNLDVIGHNIANSNTAGFKRSRAEFNEMVAASMGGCCGNQAGTGVSVADVAQQFTQGTIVPTSNGLDMAINGNGFFVVQTPTGQAFTRSGNFQLDRTGKLVTVNGDKVMGFPVDPETGVRSGSDLKEIEFPTGKNIPAKQTTEAKAIINLNAAANPYPGTSEKKPTDSAGMGTSIQVFDSLGVSRNLQMYFRKVEPNDANVWEVFSTLDAAKNAPLGLGAARHVLAEATKTKTAADEAQTEADTNFNTATSEYTAAKSALTGGDSIDDNTGEITNGGTKVTPTTAEQKDAVKKWEAWKKANTVKTQADKYAADAATQLTEATRKVAEVQAAASENKPFATIAFDRMGKVAKVSDKSGADVGTGFTVTHTVDADSSSMFYTPGRVGTGAASPIDIKLDFSDMTQFSNQFSVAKLSQNGYTSGELTSVSVDDEGVLQAKYSNGVTRAEAQVALARFVNMQGLQPAGNNNWLASREAGDITLGTAKTSNFGAIEGSALEEANVDLTTELVGMMSAQRHYQANAQQIKTQDQIFSTLINLR